MPYHTSFVKLHITILYSNDRMIPSLSLYCFFAVIQMVMLGLCHKMKDSRDSRPTMSWSAPPPPSPHLHCQRKREPRIYSMEGIPCYIANIAR
jgi:hypothetical protein